MLHMYLNSNTVIKNNHSLNINTIKLFRSPFLKKSAALKYCHEKIIKMWWKKIMKG